MSTFNPLPLSELNAYRVAWLRDPIAYGLPPPGELETHISRLRARNPNLPSDREIEASLSPTTDSDKQAGSSPVTSVFTSPGEVKGLDRAVGKLEVELSQPRTLPNRLNIRFVIDIHGRASVVTTPPDSERTSPLPVSAEIDNVQKCTRCSESYGASYYIGARGQHCHTCLICRKHLPKPKHTVIATPRNKPRVHCGAVIDLTNDIEMKPAATVPAVDRNIEAGFDEREVYEHEFDEERECTRCSKVLPIHEYLEGAFIRRRCIRCRRLVKANEAKRRKIAKRAREEEGGKEGTLKRRDRR